MYKTALNKGRIPLIQGVYTNRNSNHPIIQREYSN